MIKISYSRVLKVDFVVLLDCTDSVLSNELIAKIQALKPEVNNLKQSSINLVKMLSGDCTKIVINSCGIKILNNKNSWLCQLGRVNLLECLMIRLRVGQTNQCNVSVSFEESTGPRLFKSSSFKHDRSVITEMYPHSYR